MYNLSLTIINTQNANQDEISTKVLPFSADKVENATKAKQMEPKNNSNVHLTPTIRRNKHRNVCRDDYDDIQSQ